THSSSIQPDAARLPGPSSRRSSHWACWASTRKRGWVNVCDGCDKAACAADLTVRVHPAGRDDRRRSTAWESAQVGERVLCVRQRNCDHGGEDEVQRVFHFHFSKDSCFYPGTDPVKQIAGHFQVSEIMRLSASQDLFSMDNVHRVD